MSARNLCIGDRVLIKTSYGGCYHGNTGVVIKQIHDDRSPVNGWFWVRLDFPANNGGLLVKKELFKAKELKKIYENYLLYFFRALHITV